jgi:hypothetical protein
VQSPNPSHASSRAPWIVTYKEVPMARTRHHVPAFDSLEGKVLLSTGMADPAATVYKQKAIRFNLDGTLRGIPYGTSIPDGYLVSSFSANGSLKSMGYVEAAIFLKNTFISKGKMPNLSKATLVLFSRDGTVTLSLNASGSHHYKFTVMSGTGPYSFATGTGKITITGNHNYPNYTLRVQSNG